MTPNTLVRHLKKPNLGICCVAKNKGQNKVVINVGIDDAITCKTSLLEIVNTDHCKTKTFAEYRARFLNERPDFDYCIVGNVLQHFVGIGWVTIRAVTANDLEKYPRIIH